MKFSFILLCICSFIYSCQNSDNLNPNPSNSGLNSNNLNNNDSNDTLYLKQKINYSNPVIIDSSDWVYYELSFGGKTLNSNSYTKSKREAHKIWNIVFYNTNTKEYNSLSNKKMIINYPYYNKSSNTISNPNSNLIFYSIISDDYNKDGKLNEKDPQYLYYSELSGENLTQVSPSNHDLISFETLEQDNLILIQAVKDSNQDNKFSELDELVNFIYDIKTNQIKEVFSDKFKLNLKKILVDQWEDNNE